MAAGDPLQYINIKDFAPGISDNPGARYPPGAAQTNGTFRCIANRAGALIPLPLRTEPFHMPHDGTPTDGRYGLVGLYVPPISMLPTVLAFNPNLFPEHELMVGNEWIEGGNRHNILRRVRRYETTGTLMDTIKNVSGADPAVTLTANGMGFGATRSNRATPTTPGVPVVIAMWGTGATLQYLTEFPNDQLPAVNAPFDIFSNVIFLLGICEHQGRTVAQQATAYGQGVNTATFMGENLVWSATNDVTPANWNTATPQVFVPENPSGFAALVSMSANQLFGLKTHGAMYASGDLFDPTIVPLPMVVGSEVLQTPIITTLGVVYVNSTSGVWTWGGSDKSELLSPQMDPKFWMVDTNEFDSFGGVRYQLAICDEWILVPNNWLYDTRLNSWWRMEDPSLLRIRNWTSLSHFIYGSESFYTNASDTPVHFWQREDSALTYSWQSHPVWETVGNLTDIREITIRAAGQGTITVTLTGENMTQTVQFSVNNDLPILSRQNIRIQDSNIAVKLEVDGPVVAPTVYECNLGYFQAQKETTRQ
jgi:hypothetical protein